MKSILDFQKAKNRKQKISMITCYDSSFAKIVELSDVDCILVGDSVMMTVHGHENTLSATTEIMALHTSAVRRGAPTKFLVADMPFLAHRGSLDRTLENVKQLMQAGANAVKIEGADGSLETIAALVESGVPVMGHLGLTPQSVHQLGGFRVQGKTEDAAAKILAQARGLQNAGCFAIVLECVPQDVGTAITNELSIPTIGIGAGPDTDGQVLVIQDLLSMNAPGTAAKFVRPFLDGRVLITQALNDFHRSVRDVSFPNESESYPALRSSEAVANTLPLDQKVSLYGSHS